MPGIDLPGLALQVDGTLAEHRAVFRTIVLPAAPADGNAEQQLQPRAIDIELDANWRAEPGDRQRWQARIEQVLVQTITREAERAIFPLDAVDPQSVLDGLREASKHREEVALRGAENRHSAERFDWSGTAAMLRAQYLRAPRL